MHPKPIENDQESLFFFEALPLGTSRKEGQSRIGLDMRTGRNVGISIGSLGCIIPMRDYVKITRDVVKYCSFLEYIKAKLL